MPIRVQHHSGAGAALQLAHQTGQAQYAQQRDQEALALLQSTRQSRLAEQRLQAEAQRLQLADAGRRNIANTPTSGVRTFRRNPLTESVTQPSQNAAQSVPATQYAPSQFGLPTAQGTGHITENDRVIAHATDGAVSPLDESRARGSFVSNQPSASAASPTSQYLQTLAGREGVTEQQRRELAVLDQIVVSQGLTGNQTRNAAEGIMRTGAAGGLSPEFVARQELSGISNRSRDLIRQRDRLTKTLQDAGYDPSGPPTQFNSVVREDIGGPYSLTTPHQVFGRNLNPFGQPGVLEDGADLSIVRAYGELSRVQQELGQLEQERQGILAPGSPQTSASPVDLSEQSVDDLLRQLLQG